MTAFVHSRFKFFTGYDMDTLESDLAGKALISHSHAQADIQNLITDLSNKSAVGHNHDSSYSVLSHNHDSSYSVLSHNHSGVYEPILPSKTGNALKYMRVNAGETGFEYSTIAAGMGYALQGTGLALATITDGATYYFGNKAVAIDTTADNKRIYIIKPGTLKIAKVYMRAATAGTAENISVYIRKNNTTDTLIATLGISNNHRVFSNIALSISFIDGDYFEFKVICPTWVTNPATVWFDGMVYLE